LINKHNIRELTTVVC